LVRDGFMLVVVAIACFGSLMVSYVRARAEGLGLVLMQGRAQRPERYVLLGFGAWLSGLVDHLSCAVCGTRAHGVLAVAVSLLALLAAWTVVQRTRQALRDLAAEGGR